MTAALAFCASATYVRLNIAHLSQKPRKKKLMPQGQYRVRRGCNCITFVLHQGHPLQGALILSFGRKPSEQSFQSPKTLWDSFFIVLELHLSLDCNATTAKRSSAIHTMAFLSQALPEMVSIICFLSVETVIVRAVFASSL